VTDFPEHGAGHRMSDHDLIKETYLHSNTLRWSAGGIRGRTTEWQWPASQLKMRNLLRGLIALGFTGVLIDRHGYAPDVARHEVDAIHRWLGRAIDRRGDRLLAWDLRRAAPALRAGLDAPARARLRQAMLDAPRLYLDTTASPITDRGEAHAVCHDARLQLVNPGRRAERVDLELELRRGHSDATRATLELAGRRVPLSIDEPTRVGVTLRPGITRAPIAVRIPRVRCDDVERDDLPTIAARLLPRDA
jgi:hypothetical protein